jgi:hypothetical protein
MTSTLQISFSIRGVNQTGVIYVKDGLAILQTNDWRVAKQMFDEESKDEKAKVSWDSKRRVMLEFFASQKEADIVTELKARLANLKRM